ncbi:MAG TPA: chorismate pyruvate-lyase family protein [Blastococcus sp.]
MDGLGLLERILMTSDGTVTIMLEQIVGEPIATAGLAHSVAPVDPDTAAVLPFPVSSLIRRTTRLVGASTGTLYVRATSVFSPDALPKRVCAALRRTDEPIGRLLRRERVESFREILSIEVPDDAGPPEPRRRYLICIGGRPAVHIEEIFTASCFTSSGNGPSVARGMINRRLRS